MRQGCKDEQGSEEAATSARAVESRASRPRRRRRSVTPRFARSTAKNVVPALTKQFGYKNPMQVPRLRRSSSTWASARPWRTRRSSTPPSTEHARHHRSEAGRHARQEGDRDLQAARGHAHRRRWSRCAASACGSSSIAWSRSRCRACATSAACRPRASTARATTRSVCKEQIIFPEIDYDRIDVDQGA